MAVAEPRCVEPPGHDFVCASTDPRDTPPRPAPARDVSSRHPESRIMQRYVAPLGFTLAAAWVVLVFILVRATP
ncbi:hypothetical protein [Plantactinospora sp. KLBMP9567]|uniref:hypothetical protein n=1 Tax=Plantactinospora sp. KLBMP9567 TaxID=3085900 RepID=UPI0029826B89|nr:hypothetical protein [Plantactinospora sp. KLBMP9567]MDW5328176.1 hypothetical protein [Plantactinospora sp. KLBMP9567]